MNRAWLLASLLSLLGTVSCAPGSPTGESERSEGDVEALTLDVTVLPITKPSSPSGITVITKKADFVAFFGQQPPAGLNFNQSWVVHYSMGIQNTGGWHADVASIDRVGSGASAKLVVHAQETSPGPNCPVTQSLTNPQVTVKIPKQKKGIPVETIYSSIVTDCGTVQNWCASALCGPDERCDEFQDACVDDRFCIRAKCANGYVCDEDANACVGRPCDPDDSNSCPSGFQCSNHIQCITTPCPADFRCEPAPEVTCDDIGWVGVCQGPTLKYCDGDAMTVVDCAPGQCDYVDSAAYYDCVP